METDDFDIKESRVTYSTKELLQQINNRFDKLEAITMGLATDDQVQQLAERVESLEVSRDETRIVAAALVRAGQRRWSRNEKIVAFLFALTTIVLNLLTLGPDLFH